MKAGRAEDFVESVKKQWAELGTKLRIVAGRKELQQYNLITGT